MLKTRRLNFIVLCLTAFVVGIFLCALVTSPALRAKAESAHNDCEEYCLVCDLAGKINALPEAEDITTQNLASVIQQINDIDRIKYDLTDEEFEELTLLVETHDDGVESNVITRYATAVDKARELSGSGVNFAIAKSFNLGDEAVSDTSEAEVKILIQNVDSGVSTTLTLFDLGASTSALGDEFYSMTADGWYFGYVLPEGNYVITELNLDDTITVNGKAQKFHCAKVSDGENVVEGNQISLTLSDEPKSVTFYNIMCSNTNGVTNEDTAESSIVFDCAVCGSSSIKYTLSAPDGDLVFDGTSTFTPSITREAPQETHFHTVTIVEEISYEYKENSDLEWSAISESDTYNVGHYKATLTVNDVAVSVEYKVEYKQAEILFISTPSTLTYGSVSGAISVLVKEDSAMRYEYQWYNGQGEEVTGETSSTFKLPYDLSAGDHSYYVEIRSYSATDYSSDPICAVTTSDVVNFVVGKRLAIVDINDQVITYGDTNLELTANINGLADFDSEEDVYSFDCTFDNYTSVGKYVICGHAVNDNYSITFIDGTLTVTERILEIYLSDITSEYGEELEEISYEIVNGELANGVDASQVFSFYSSADPYMPGSYEINIQNYDSNYSISYSQAFYTVNTIKVSVTFGSEREFVYDGTVQYPSYVCSVEGADPIIEAENNVGVHTATVTGFYSEIYELEEPVSVEYEIVPTKITLKADNVSKQVGELEPKLTYSIIGIVYGNYGFSDIKLTRESGEEVGTYEITITVDESKNRNYDITLQNGTFKIVNSLLGISEELDQLKLDLAEALDSKASTEDLEKAIADLEKAIKKAEDSLKYAEEDEALKEELTDEIADVKQEVLDAVRTIAREEAEKALGNNQSNEGDSGEEKTETVTNDSTMLLVTVAGMGGVTVVMLIFLIVLFAKRLRK